MSQCKNAIVMAGGKSLRMGEDKALLPFGKYDSLTHYQYIKLQKLFDTVYISTKEKKFDFEANFIYDNYNESSPLVALLSIFESIKAESIFILSVDAPFVDKEVIDELLRKDEAHYDIVIAASPSGEQPLCGIYKKSTLPAILRQYTNGNHKLKDLLKSVNTLHVVFEEDKPFTNLNHPSEYQDALKASITQVSSS